jgi:hypothetical protein
MKLLFLSKNALLYALFFLILPNLFFWILSHYIFVARGFFNIDYLFIGAIIYFLPTALAIVLFAGILSADFIFSIMPAYHFSDTSILQSLDHVFKINLFHMYFLICIALVLIYFIIKSLKSIATKQGALLCGLLFFSIIAIDLMFERKVAHNIATSTLHKIINLTAETYKAKQTLIHINRAESASQLALNDLSENDLPDHIVLIVAESLGVFKDESLNQLQWRGLPTMLLESRYIITQGTIPTKGSTVPGELRELCHIQVNTVHPSAELLAEQQCIVKDLQKIGFHTSALHGFSGTFFNRFQWYPMIGFDEALFINDLEQELPNKEYCGSVFKGLCDTQILDLIHQKLLSSKNEKTFIYYLTLNTHLPIDKVENSTLDCSLSQETTTYPALCRIIQQHDVFFTALNQIIMDPHLPPSLFVIVGDHPPTFLNRDHINLFIESRVPYMILKPIKR